MWSFEVLQLSGAETAVIHQANRGGKGGFDKPTGYVERRFADLADGVP